jgi:hypothetical protein
MESFQLRAHIALRGGWEPPLSEGSYQGIRVMLLGGRQQIVYLSFTKLAEDGGLAWHVSVMYSRDVPSYVRRRYSTAVDVRRILRGFERNAETQIEWEVVAFLRLPEEVRSVIALPIPVEDEWATDIRGLRFVKMSDDDVQELYSVIVDRPQSELTHQVGFRRAGRVTAASVQAWMHDAVRISELFVVRGEEIDAAT